ncbi:MAG: TIGR02300 family protein, partial [Terricaulis sp.]
MAKTDLGAKQSCPSCGAKFYDLNRRPAVCPKCTTSFDPAEEGVRAKRGRARANANETSYDDDEDTPKKKTRAGGDDDEDEEEESEEAAALDAEEGEADPVVTDDD